MRHSCGPHTTAYRSLWTKENRGRGVLQNCHNPTSLLVLLLLSSKFNTASSFGYTSMHESSKIYLKTSSIDRNFIDRHLNFTELNCATTTTTCQRVSAPSKSLGLFIWPLNNSFSSLEALWVCKLEIEEDLSSLEFNFHYGILGTA